MRLRAAAAAVLVLACLLTVWFLPVEQLLRGFQTWLSINPKLAFLALTAVLVLAVLLMLPSSVMMMSAGFLLGLPQGFAAVWISGLIASTMAFLIARTLARPWIERRVGRRSTFIAIDRAIQRRGLLVVLLTRLVMVLPFPALNYTLGLTRVPVGNFVLGTNIGMVPAMLLFVYLGTTFSDLAALIRGDMRLQGGQLLFSLLLAGIAILALVIIVRIAGRALRDELRAAAAQQVQEENAS